MTLRVVEKLAYHCSLKGAAELMRRDRLLPTCAARRLPTTTAACTAVPLRESKRATSSPFVTVTYLAIGAAPFSYVGLARCAERVAPNRRVGTRRHHCKRRRLCKANETWMKRVETRASGGAGRTAAPTRAKTTRRPRDACVDSAPACRGRAAVGPHDEEYRPCKTGALAKCRCSQRCEPDCVCHRAATGIAVHFRSWLRG